MVFKFKKDNTVVEKIYQNILNTSRSKLFYLRYDVDDAFESRFDIIVMHAFIIFQYFLDAGVKKSEIAQSIFDLMFNDFDNNLRELGFGDIAVNKKMKSFIVAFYGRVANYSKSIDEYKKDGSIYHLSVSIKKNIYKGREVKNIYLDSLSNYILDNLKNFSSNNYQFNIDNYFKFKIQLKDSV